MSSINPGSVNLPSSFAGAQRNDANVDKQNAEANQQNRSIDQKAMADHQLHDVGDANKSGDRDADGRMPLDHEGAGEQDANSDSQTADTEKDHSKRNLDAEGELGTNLDLDA